MAESGRAAGRDTKDLFSLSSLDRFHIGEGDRPCPMRFLFFFLPPDGRYLVSKQPGGETRKKKRGSACVFARSRHMGTSHTPESEGGGGGSQKDSSRAMRSQCPSRCWRHWTRQWQHSSCGGTGDPPRGPEVGQSGQPDTRLKEQRTSVSGRRHSPIL